MENHIITIYIFITITILYIYIWYIPLISTKDLLLGLREPRIEASFLLHRRHAAVLVVVARAHHGVTGQGEDLCVDVFIEKPGIAWENENFTDLTKVFLGFPRVFTNLTKVIP